MEQKNRNPVNVIIAVFPITLLLFVIIGIAIHICSTGMAFDGRLIRAVSFFVGSSIGYIHITVSYAKYAPNNWLNYK